jgi:cation/acetate symporter
LVSSVALTVVSPSVWEATLGNPKGSAWFPYTSPALFSMAIGFAGIWLFSLLDRSVQAARERAAFPAQQVRSETGLGAAGASGH